MTYERAKELAEKYKAVLAPYCKRIEIAGSIRRRKPEVKDIEIVCIRDTKKLFTWAAMLESLRILKGEAIGKYVKIGLDEGIALDLFMCFENNWGFIFAIRTGSADFSHLVLGNAWVKAGFKGECGYLTRDGKKIFIKEEEDLFKLCKLEFVPPELREVKF